MTLKKLESCETIIEKEQWLYSPNSLEYIRGIEAKPKIKILILKLCNFQKIRIIYEFLTIEKNLPHL